MVFIEGIAFPLDFLNENGWGIPASEAENAISSLRKAVIRICPRDEPHGCDFSEDPFSEIGHIADVWRDGNDVHVLANITDSVASRKIEDGTWTNGWSIYTYFSDQQDGWLSDIDIKSLTLVDDPAWDKAYWTVAASEDERSSLRFFRPYKILTAGLTMPGETEPTPDGGVTPADFEDQLAENQRLIDELTTTNQTLKEQLETLNVELTELRNAAASKDIELSKRITLEEAKSMIAAAIEADHEAQAKETAFSRLAAARRKGNLETNADDYRTFSASELDKLADDFEMMMLAASKTPEYPATSQKYMPRTGIFDPVKGYVGGN